ncbi:zinc finger and SCAN domain-containing protein 2-like isoform X3 [Nerophis ophidion]|nr:zinc finger and SCAN domain-containing protein 2-like isoform X3 [Nerophis ophidion]XP_061771161.1 zinc finger and SCAN domain-containing protein 2-like isoform X3 [Nerophis ophidion]
MNEEEEEPHSPHIKEEEEDVWISQEEADLSKFPLTLVSVKTEDKTPESSQLHHSPDIQQMIGLEEQHEDSQPDHFQDGQNDPHLKKEEGEPLSPHIKEEEEHPQSPSVKVEEEEPQASCVKEEEEEVWISQCLVGQEEADLCYFPLTVKTGDHGEKPPESSQLQESKALEASSCMTPEADGGSPADQTFAPLSDSDDAAPHLNIKMGSHRRTHRGEKPFSCSVCGRGFSDKSNMKSHMKTHTGEKPFSCSVCGKLFSNKRNMLIHMRKYTGEKPFSCPACSKTFSSKSILAGHMGTHTGEKPFGCPVCGNAFSRKAHLKNHLRTHTGEKQFSCSVCCKRFSSKSNLNSHMKTHSVEKPFACVVCRKGFAVKYNLARHMRVHTE